jgi:hypothetical protein
MAVEAGSTAGVEDFTEVVGSAVEAGAASGADRDSAAAADFVAARSAEERDFAEGQDFAVERSAAAFEVTASAAAGAFADAVGVGEDGAGVGTGASASAGRIGVGPDTRIPTDMGTTRGRRLITRPAMIPTAILTTSLRPPILRLATRIQTIHTGTTGTGMLRRRARRPAPPMTGPVAGPMTETTGPTTGTTRRRRPHRWIPGRRRRIPTVRRARMA